MFNAFSWFEKPELFASARAAVLEWAGAEERLVYQLSQKNGATLEPETRLLNTSELAVLKRNAERAWQRKSFGGFITGKNLTELKGVCFFDLNSEKTAANLTGLVLDKALAEFPPLQNPALLLALLGLRKEAPTVEKINFPFGEVTQEDQLTMRMFKIGLGEEAGSWLTNQQFTRKINFLTYALDLGTYYWQEVKFMVEPGLYNLALHYFSRYGFPEKIQVHFSISRGPLGEELKDSTAPVTIQSYVPINERHTDNLMVLQNLLNGLALLNPYVQLDLREVPLAEVKIQEIKVNYNEAIYRVGRKFVIKIKKEDIPAPEYTPLPEDLILTLIASSAVFGPQIGYIHPTSRITLELLEKWLDPGLHRNVLDLGTGTGALSIAAARLGINQILAIDPNRAAIEVARKNMILNNLEDRITVEAGSLGLKDKEDDTSKYLFEEELQKRSPSLDKSLPFDAILANIYPQNLITMSGVISASLKPRGLLISGGIPTKDIESVLEAYAAVGLELVAKQDLDGWNGFVSRKV